MFFKKKKEEAAPEAAKIGRAAKTGGRTARCPRCHVPLEQHTVTTDVQRRKVEVDVCYKGCGGVWIQAEDMKADTRRNLLLDEELLTLNLPKRMNVRYDAPARCPDCAVVMEREDWRGMGLFIDVCGECKGRWFDGGEIGPVYEVLLQEHHGLKRKQPGEG